jgi:hypothetical protein
MNINGYIYYIDNIDEFLDIIRLEKFKKAFSDVTMEKMMVITFSELIIDYKDNNGENMKELQAKRFIRYRNNIKTIDPGVSNGGGKKRKKKRKTKRKTRKRKTKKRSRRL